jgi:hypothetical protein
MTSRLFALCLVSVAGVLSPPAAAGQMAGETRPREGPAVIDGAPPPVAPASINRDEQGRATVRAIRLTEPLVLDGRLDEAVYSEVDPFGDFVQAAPLPGEPSTERTDVWVSFDDANVYVTCRCWDGAPPETWVANELRRDTPGLRNNEHFGVMFDTFYDRRNGVMFYANPLGARSDYAVVDEGGPNTDWNPVWDVAAGTFEGGWIVEMAIPFKSLRYNAGRNQVWGIQFRRSIRHKNEWAYLNPVPTFLAGPQALNRVSAGGTIVGLDLPPAGNNLEVKPYAIGGLTTDKVATPVRTNDATGDAGLDLKYGLTANLTLDLTLNTDFAQVEVDEQQVNLTRFSLFFPEKREFFLEGRGVFDFGQGGTGGFFGGGGGGGGRGGGNDRPTLFYSRRIGLDQGKEIPIVAGGRVTGKVGAFSVGALSIRTGADDSGEIPGTTFSVLRLKRDILGRSSVGALFTDRSIAASGGGANRVYGVDGSLNLTQDLQLGGYWARTETPRLAGRDESWQAALSYQADLFGFETSMLEVGDAFNPEVGFVRRSDFRKSAGSVRYSPRPASIDWVRKVTFDADVSYFEDGLGRMESRRQSGSFQVEMESSDMFSIEAVREFERIDSRFPVAASLEVPEGRYTFTSYRASYTAGPQRRVSGGVSYQWGAFYHGSIRSLSVNQGRIVVSNHLSLEPGVSLNFIDLPQGESTRTLFRLRADYAFTPRMFASSLLQYDDASKTFSSNLRFRWEYAPGSEFFVVWTDERETGSGGSGLRARGLVLKVTRLLRY